MGGERPRHRVVVTLLSVALAVALVALVLTWRQARHETGLREAGSSAVTAAGTAAVALTTYDYRTLAEDHQRVLDLGTAKFRTSFTSVSKSASAAVTSLQVTAKGSVIAAAPLVRDSRHVQVLVFLDQRVTSKGHAGSQTEEPRLSMSMVEQDGKWLVDAVELESSGS